MILLIVISTFLMAVVSIYQFKKEADEYHKDRLERKENAIKEHIFYVLENTTYPLTTENLPLIFKDKIYEMADIHNLEINFFDLEGKILKSSKSNFRKDSLSPFISSHVLNLIKNNVNKRYVDINKKEDITYRSSFTILEDLKFKPIGILNLPYIEDEDHYEREINKFFIGLGQVYFFMLIFAFGIAYILSAYITQAIKAISEKINETNLGQRNEKIKIQSKSQEINLLINAYNVMVDALEESAVKLAQNEREEAWREMAKQVAHEVKNPLTPMRLTIQSFQRKFDPNDPNIHQKLNDYTQLLLQQIDIMSSVASAFSTFASMPIQHKEKIDVVQAVKLSLDIFNENFIILETDEQEIFTQIDRSQLIRVMTNLIKNAIQAIPTTQKTPRVNVRLWIEHQMFKISVRDNGVGILEDDFDRIFEPKFTTKSSGMGLGLGIIKNIIESYQGNITFTSEYQKGTEFIVSIPLEN
jgi:two-component system nitrogen regulation sensor histidine kinase NtrY